MMLFVPARIACAVCKKERVFAQYGEDDGVPAYRWEECPEHPGADTINLCIRCGSENIRCAVRRCQRHARQHVLVNNPDPDEKEYPYVSLGLCEPHFADDAKYAIAKHYWELTKAEAEEMTRQAVA